MDALGEQVSDSGSALVTVAVAACDGVRYVDMGDGTILDCNTSLFWLKDASCSALPGTNEWGMADWDNAMSASASLASGICGLSDGSTAGQWRLPAMAEWCGGWDGSGSGAGLCDPALGLINGNYTNPAVGNTAGDGQWSNGDPFIGLWTSGYWSSTENTGDPTKSWYVEMVDGSIYPALKSFDSALVWPVRDPL